MTECPIHDEDGFAYRTCETDEVLRVLADERRREIVSELEALAESWITTEKLIQSVCSDERADGGWEGELLHVHLPMLQDVGLIDYDRDGEVIRYYHCDLVTAVLETVEREVPPVP